MYNEAQKIAACLDTLGWARERLVIDLQSTDTTASIAADCGATVTKHDWEPFGEPVRNFAVDLASSTWVLLIDADEHVSQELATTIKRVVQEDWPCDVVMIPRSNIIFGKVMFHSDAIYSEAVEYFPKLFRKGTISWPVELHHLPVLDHVRVQRLDSGRDGALNHDTRQSIDDSLQRLLRYTRREALDLLDDGAHFSISAAVKSSIQRFLAVYFKQKTYRDGVAGFFWASECGIYRLFVWMQMWEKEGRLPAHDGPIARWGAYGSRAVAAVSMITGSTSSVRRQLARVGLIRRLQTNTRSS